MNLSNSITIGRILLSPVVAWLVYTARWQWAATLFIIVAFSDLLDGYLARRYKEVDKLGAFLDPLADKVFVTLVFAALMVRLHLPWWYWLILTRDVLVAGGALYGAGARVSWNFTASTIGKIVTLLQIIVVSLIILYAMAGVTLGILLPVLVILTSSIGGIAATHYLFKAKTSLPRNKQKK